MSTLTTPDAGAAHTSDLAATRLARAQDAVRESGWAAILISAGTDLRYLAGFEAHLSERLNCLIVPAEGDPVLVLPKLEVPLAERGGATVRIEAWTDQDDPYALVRRQLPSAADGRVGVANRMWAEHALGLGAVLGARLELAGPLLAGLRMRKDAAEVEQLALAGAAIDRVHARMGEWLRPGRTEAEIGADIAAAIVEEGHTAADFVIVGSGPNGASPHHALSDRVVETGDPVVIDIGGPLPTGYFSDSTRTYLAGGTAAPEVADLYAVLAAAQEASVQAVRPGVLAAEVDSAARTIISDAGYGEFFIHRTGHGIGLDVHEDPYISSANQLPLEPGMAFSVEPGIYLPGRHGARIEDIVVCTEDGARRLNNRPHELVVLAG